MTSPPSLLTLPAELQSHIATYLIPTGKLANPSSHLDPSLLNLCVTCHTLAPIARDALCTWPILQSSKVHILLSFLARYPELASRIKHLTIETREIHTYHGSPKRIPRLDNALLSHLERHMRILPISKPDKDNTIAALKVPRFQDHAVLIELLLSLLPGLTTLHLGASTLINFPFLHTLFPVDPETESVSSSSAETTTQHTPQPATAHWLLPLIAPRLTALEVPLDLRHDFNADPWTTAHAVSLPLHFPNLTWLSIPHSIATQTENAHTDIIPARLQTLILTDARCGCFAAFAESLLHPTPSTSPPTPPPLSHLHIYHRYATPGTCPSLLADLAAAGVHVHEYIPECCLRSGDEFFHPWRYGEGEIGVREGGRHEEYESVGPGGRYWEG